MQINKKEMDLDALKEAIRYFELEYNNICKINFTPTNKHFHILATIIGFLIWLSILAFIISGISDVKTTNFIGFLTLLLLVLFIEFLFTNLELFLSKFYLSNFSNENLETIKSYQFLLSEFKKHLISNKTAVSSEFSKIAKNYRKELKNKIKNLSNLKESLERENLIKSMR